MQGTLWAFDEIESVAEQLGTIGANLSELEVATEGLKESGIFQTRDCPGWGRMR